MTSFSNPLKGPYVSMILRTDYSNVEGRLRHWKRGRSTGTQEISPTRSWKTEDFDAGQKRESTTDREEAGGVGRKGRRSTREEGFLEHKIMSLQSSAKTEKSYFFQLQKTRQVRSEYIFYFHINTTQIFPWVRGFFFCYKPKDERREKPKSGGSEVGTESKRF